MSEATKSRIGYLPEERGLYEDMTVLDTLLFLGQLKGLSRRAAQERTEYYLREVELWEAHERKIGALSRGMNQKAQFVAATMHDPELIIIDEPFGGLVAMGLSLIPFSAPVAMLMRLTGAVVPTGQTAASLGLLVLTALGTIWLMARLFRIRTLLSSESISMRRMWAALQSGRGA